MVRTIYRYYGIYHSKYSSVVRHIQVQEVYPFQKMSDKIVFGNFSWSQPVNFYP